MSFKKLSAQLRAAAKGGNLVHLRWKFGDLSGQNTQKGQDDALDGFIKVEAAVEKLGGRVVECERGTGLIIECEKSKANIVRLFIDGLRTHPAPALGENVGLFAAGLVYDKEYSADK